jgi:hypothetical protein
MTSMIERVQREMLDEYEREGHVDVTQWINRHPELRDEIVDFRMELELLPNQEELDRDVGPWEDEGIAEKELERHCQALSLGESWTEEAVRPSPDDPRTDLGRHLQRVRSEGHSQQGRTPNNFRRAVIYAWTISELAANDRVATRLAVQKSTYFLERALGLGLFLDHTQQPLGPYDPSARYKDAEPIALKKLYIEKVGPTRFQGGNEIAQIQKYIGNYLFDVEAAKALIAFLATLSDHQLETLATVDWVARSLKLQEPGPASANAVVEELRKIPTWRAKLRRSNFGLLQIEEALRRLSRLGLLQRPA